MHQLRPHPGQINVARRLRSLLHSEAYPSAIAESHRFCDRVQDAYTLRCCPQVSETSDDPFDFYFFKKIQIIPGSRYCARYNRICTKDYHH